MKVFNASPLILLLEELKQPDLLRRLKKLDKLLFVPPAVIREISYSQSCPENNPAYRQTSQWCLTHIEYEKIKRKIKK